ncbi:MAG: hypothetical protein LUC47_02305 [Clostridiales bacterium]|nr:hypothetical protein [Clostridiales bacterium]
MAKEKTEGTPSVILRIIIRKRIDNFAGTWYDEVLYKLNTAPFLLSYKERIPRFRKKSKRASNIFFNVAGRVKQARKPVFCGV